MRLKIKEFEKLAKKRGYRGGKALIEELGAGKYAYSNLKRGCKIGYDLVKAIYYDIIKIIYVTFTEEKWKRKGGKLMEILREKI